MTHPPRSASPAAGSLVATFVAGAVLLLPAPRPAAGQDFEDVIRGIRQFRDLQERFEEREDDRRDRDNRDRNDRRNVDPRGRSGPPGLYGPGAPSGPGSPYESRSGSQFGQSGPYGPNAPYGYGPQAPYDYQFPGSEPRNERFSPINYLAPQRPGGNAVQPPGPEAFSDADPPGAPDARIYMMRNPEMRSAEYRLDGLPGGPLTVQTVNDSDGEYGRGRGRARLAAEAEAARAAAAARRALNDLVDALRDPRYALRYANAEAPGGAGRGRNLASQGIDAMEKAIALSRALRPGLVTFVAAGEVNGFGAGGESVRLAGWSDQEFAQIEAAFRAFEQTTPRWAAEIAPVHNYLRLRASKIDRLRLAVDASISRLRTARRQLRRPGIGPRPEAIGDRPVGGEDRLRLFALSARLTERAADLSDAALADPVLTSASGGAGGFVSPAAGGGLDALRGPDFGNPGFGGGNVAAADDPVQAAARVESTALAIAAALAGGADGRTVSAADADFERALSEWNAAMRAATGAVGPTAATARAFASVEEVHRALHGEVPQTPPGGGNGGGNGNLTVRGTAASLARSATDFARQVPRLDLRALGRTNPREFAAAANGLSAAAGYYSAVAAEAPPGAAVERQARGVLESAVDSARPGLKALSGGGRRDNAANLARNVLNDLSNWQSAIRSTN